MNYITNLIKGFFRSVVNQVGRDGGKVISNNVYNGAHSTPISVKAHSTPISKRNETSNESIEEMDKENLPKQIDYGVFHFFLTGIKLAVGAILLFLIAVILSSTLSFIIGLIFSFIYLLTTTAKYIRPENREVEVKDGRRKEGFRIDNKIFDIEYILPLSTFSLWYNRIISILIFIFSLLMLLNF